MVNRRQILNGLTILGILCCIELAIVYYQANYNPYAFPSFCNINGFVDCDGVAQTSKAVFLGVPLTYWGLFLYMFVLMLLHVDKLKKYKFLWFLNVFKNPLSYISVLGVVSFLISITLACISIFQIKKICLLCFVTYFINLAIGIISTDFSNGGLLKSIKDSFFDFIEGVKNYTKPFIIAMLIIASFLTYTTCEMPFASKKQSIKHYMFMKKNPYKTSGNVLGNPSGKYIVHLYTDFKCPVCFSYNIMLQKLVKENNEIMIYHHNLPLDIKYNKYLTRQIHDGSGEMAKYAIAAENQGKYWDMANELFENPPENYNDVINIAKKINLNLEQFEKDIVSKETDLKLSVEIDSAIKRGVDGTPTIIVEDNLYYGAKPYYELKRIIIKK